MLKINDIHINLSKRTIENVVAFAAGALSSGILIYFPFKKRIENRCWKQAGKNLDGFMYDLSSAADRVSYALGRIEDKASRLENSAYDNSFYQALETGNTIKK